MKPLFSYKCSVHTVNGGLYEAQDEKFMPWLVITTQGGHLYGRERWPANGFPSLVMALDDGWCGAVVACSKVAQSGESTDTMDWWVTGSEEDASSLLTEADAWFFTLKKHEILFVPVGHFVIPAWFHSPDAKTPPKSRLLVQWKLPNQFPSVPEPTLEMLKHTIKQRVLRPLGGSRPWSVFKESLEGYF